MLVLTRRLDQSIVIGDPKKPDGCIEVVVVEVRGDQVRLGVKAPRSVSVDRKEIREAKQQECPVDPPLPAAVPTPPVKR